MTRKDYEAIARAIQNVGGLQHDKESVRALSEVARQLANHMAADNPRFDRARFLKACGVAS